VYGFGAAHMSILRKVFLPVAGSEGLLHSPAQGSSLHRTLRPAPWAVWAGASGGRAARLLDAAIILCTCGRNWFLRRFQSRGKERREEWSAGRPSGIHMSISRFIPLQDLMEENVSSSRLPNPHGTMRYVFPGAASGRGIYRTSTTPVSAGHRANEAVCNWRGRRIFEGRTFLVMTWKKNGARGGIPSHSGTDLACYANIRVRRARPLTTFNPLRAIILHQFGFKSWNRHRTQRCGSVS